MPASYRFVVRGRVQGVGFRQAAAAQARRLGLRGWVHNCGDGSVEGIACGETAALESLRAWLALGPPAAKVDAVDWDAVPDAAREDGFAIRR